MNTLSTIIFNADAEIVEVSVTCEACGRECSCNVASTVRRDDVFDLYNQDYSAERESLFCPLCIAWINDEYQPADPIDAAFDGKLDR